MVDWLITLKDFDNDDIVSNEMASVNEDLMILEGKWDEIYLQQKLPPKIVQNEPLTPGYLYAAWLQCGIPFRIAFSRKKILMLF